MLWVCACVGAFGCTGFRSPTMAGGLFAINKEYFLKLGTWDPGLLLWGGENLELSFKVSREFEVRKG